MNWAMIQGRNCSKARSRSLMQTFIFSIFIWIYTKGLNLVFALRLERRATKSSSVPFLVRAWELLHPYEGFWMCSLHTTSSGRAADWEEDWAGTMRLPNYFITPN